MPTLFEDRPPFLDPSTVRLALNERGIRIYVALDANQPDGICVFIEAPSWAGSSGHPRSVLRTYGATISTHHSSHQPGVVVCGVVPDLVSAVVVDGVEATLRNNAYLAVLSSYPESIVVRTPDGERRVNVGAKGPTRD